MGDTDNTNFLVLVEKSQILSIVREVGNEFDF